MREARDRRSGQVQTADSPAKINHIQTPQVFLQSGKKYKGNKEVERLKDAMTQASGVLSA